MSLPMDDTDAEMTDLEDYQYSDGEEAATDAVSSAAGDTAGGGAAASASASATNASAAAGGAAGAPPRAARASLGVAQSSSADYRIVQTDEVRAECAKVVADVASILAVAPDCATLLLIAFK